MSWQRKIYPDLGIAIEVPSWAILLDQTGSRLVLLGFQKKEHPVAAIQFGVSMDITKYPIHIHQLAFPPADEKMAKDKFLNACHRVATTIHSGDYIYVVRDIFTDVGTVFRCVATIQKLYVPDKAVDDVTKVVASITPIVPESGRN